MRIGLIRLDLLDIFAARINREEKNHAVDILAAQMNREEKKKSKLSVSSLLIKSLWLDKAVSSV